MMKRSFLVTASFMFAAAGLTACGNPDSSGGVKDPAIVELPELPKPEPPGDVAQAQTPALSGGTLLVTQDDATVIAADPERDAVWVVDVSTRQVRARVRLSRGAEPGRVVEDKDGKVHVALRRAGQLAKIDPASGSLLSLRTVCAAPRGLAYDASNDNLHVACAGGELITLKASGGPVDRKLQLERDLRDVVVKGDHLLVSRFRSAELLEVDAAGALIGRAAPRSIRQPGAPTGFPPVSSPSTAWHTVALPDGSALMLHQRSQDTTVQIERPGGYGGSPMPCPCPCSGTPIVTTAMTIFSGTGASDVGAGASFPSQQLVVDVAASRDGFKLALISPSAGANRFRSSSPDEPFGPIWIIDRGDLSTTELCKTPTQSMGPIMSDAEPVAGAFDGAGQLWVQSRRPAQLSRLSAAGHQIFLSLEGEALPPSDGYNLFHMVTKSGIACASCHPEAGDDAHVWNFSKLGPRRTQSLRGGLLATAPFHWDGDMGDLHKLMGDVFSMRMSGPQLTAEQVRLMGEWLDAQPPLPRSAPQDVEVVLRGKALFESPAVGCKSCHDGALFTNNISVDVGTGKAFQVPALRDLAARAPYMHSGCAKTLRARFDPACGGGDRHGKTSNLSSTQLDELVAYLETL